MLNEVAEKLLEVHKYSENRLERDNGLVPNSTESQTNPKVAKRKSTSRGAINMQKARNEN